MLSVASTTPSSTADAPSAPRRSLSELPRDVLAIVFREVAPVSRTHAGAAVRARRIEAKKLLHVCRSLVGPAEDVLFRQVIVDRKRAGQLATLVMARPEIGAKIRSLLIDDATAEAAGIIVRAAVGLHHLRLDIPLAGAVAERAASTLRDGGQLRSLHLCSGVTPDYTNQVGLGLLLGAVAASVRWIILPPDLGPGLSPAGCRLTGITFPSVGRVGLGCSAGEVGAFIVGASPSLSHLSISGQFDALEHFADRVYDSLTSLAIRSTRGPAPATLTRFAALREVDIQAPSDFVTQVTWPPNLRHLRLIRCGGLSPGAVARMLKVGLGRIEKLAFSVASGVVVNAGSETSFADELAELRALCDKRRIVLVVVDRRTI